MRRAQLTNRAIDALSKIDKSLEVLMTNDRRVFDAHTILFHFAARFDQFAYLIVDASELTPRLVLGITGRDPVVLECESPEKAQGLAHEFSEWWMRHSLDGLYVFDNLLFPRQFYANAKAGIHDDGWAQIVIEFKDAASFCKTYTPQEAALYFAQDLKELKEKLEQMKMAAAAPRTIH